MNNENPMQNMMMNMPMMPDILRSSMPVFVPQMEYEQNPVSMVFGNFKRARISKASELEAQIARNANSQLTAKLDSVHQIFTFTAKVKDTLDEYQHNQDIRELTREKTKAEVQLTQSQASQAYFDAKSAEMDYEMRKMKFDGMKGGR